MHVHHPPGQFLSGVARGRGCGRVRAGQQRFAGPGPAGGALSHWARSSIRDETLQVGNSASPQPSWPRRPRRAPARMPPANTRMAVTSRPPATFMSRTPIRASAPSPWSPCSKRGGGHRRGTGSDRRVPSRLAVTPGVQRCRPTPEAGISRTEHHALAVPRGRRYLVDPAEPGKMYIINDDNHAQTRGFSTAGRRKGSSPTPTVSSS